MKPSKSIILLAGTAVLTALAACGRIPELTEENFAVQPSPLEAVKGRIPVTIFGQFPEGFMPRRAVIAMTPALRYADGSEERGNTVVFQGTNGGFSHRTISAAAAEAFSLHDDFSYRHSTERCTLFLTFNARIGKRRIKMPEVALAQGVLATADLLQYTATRIEPIFSTSQVETSIEQGTRRSIDGMCAQIALRLNPLRPIGAASYADVLKRIDEETGATAPPSTPQEASTLHDWHNACYFLSKCNIAGASEVIATLEAQASADECVMQAALLSEPWQQLLSLIVPRVQQAKDEACRTATDHTEKELLRIACQNAQLLRPDVLLYAATLSSDAATRETIFASGSAQAQSDYRFANNLAACAIQKGDFSAALQHLARAKALQSDASEVLLNGAVVCLTRGEAELAAEFLSQATPSKQRVEIAASLLIAQGHYATAAKAFADRTEHSAALAQLLAHRYGEAEATLARLPQDDALTLYLQAICYARTERYEAARTALNGATQRSEELARRARFDLEFRNL